MIAAGGAGSDLSQGEPITSQLTLANHWDHFLARLGLRRGKHRVSPGLYALGRPASDSLVFVTANYTLSFDALRSALQGIDGYILVLDTRGVNVWCAAGKGTFGTDELVHRVAEADLQNVVQHRTVILPQLGAPGVAAHEVRRRSGFSVEYGPVRAADLPEYLHSREATPEMRRIGFNLADRLVLIPVEVFHVLLPTLAAVMVLLLLGGVLPALSAVVTVLAGVVLFPVLLPLLPTRDFTSKGLILGGLAALPIAAAFLWNGQQSSVWYRAGWAAASLLVMPAVTAYLALNFTGSTTFTSRTGVEREVRTYIPILAGMAGLGVVFMSVLVGMHWIGGSQ
jgi:hypothetical protein